MLSDSIAEEGKRPSPGEFQQAITEASKPIDEGGYGKFCESKTFDVLQSE